MRRLAAMMVCTVVLTGCGGDGSGGGGSEPAAKDSPSRSHDWASRSQAVIDALVQPDEPGCSAAVGVEGEVVWEGVQGVADIDQGRRITPETVFDIGSVSKQFTATAILLLVADGKLSLRAPLSRHVGGLPGWADTVSVDQLLHQTSGIPDYFQLLADGGHEFTDQLSQEQMLQVLAAVPSLGFVPGSRWEYSNSNYVLLAEVVEQVSGQPLPGFLSSRIFQPLHLNMVMDPEPANPQKALSYAKDAKGFSPLDSHWELVGDGGIHTTPHELVRWADNYRTGTVGGEELLTAQTADPVKAQGGYRYGAGILVNQDGTLWHEGTWEGFITAFRVSPDRHTAVAVSCNINEGDAEPIATTLMSLWT
jgi:CubicO group peptidase (beta-lactamase class C family)